LILISTLIKNEIKLIPKRKSWDTAVKHYYRLGLEDNIPFELKKQIANSNKSRWKSESENKYVGNEVAEFIHQEIELVKRIGQSSTIKKNKRKLF
jgi:putative transposase